MRGNFDYCPLTNLKQKEKSLYGRRETWVDRAVQYIFFTVLGAFGMLAYVQYVGLP